MQIILGLFSSRTSNIRFVVLLPSKYTPFLHSIILPKVVYGQSNPNQVNSNTTSSVNIQDIPLKKVRVGDIDIVYKMFGKGEPILLISGATGDMNSWDPSTLKSLSSNHTVIIFDNRGVANTTTGSEAFSIQQFANDTVGLLDVLKIQKADVLGHSMGGIVAQQLAVTHPEKVNRLILVSTTCGGKDSIPPSPQLVKLATEIENKLLNYYDYLKIKSDSK